LFPKFLPSSLQAKKRKQNKNPASPVFFANGLYNIILGAFFVWKVERNVMPFKFSRFEDAHVVLVDLCWEQKLFQETENQKAWRHKMFIALSSSEPQPTENFWPWVCKMLTEIESIPGDEDLLFHISFKFISPFSDSSNLLVFMNIYL
jgi:hypothetical protein